MNAGCEEQMSPERFGGPFKKSATRARVSRKLGAFLVQLFRLGEAVRCGTTEGFQVGSVLNSPQAPVNAGAGQSSIWERP